MAPDRKWMAGIATECCSFLSCLRTFLVYTLRVLISGLVRIRTGEEKTDSILIDVEGGVQWFLAKPRLTWSEQLCGTVELVSWRYDG